MNDQGVSGDDIDLIDFITIASKNSDVVTTGKSEIPKEVYISSAAKWINKSITIEIQYYWIIVGILIAVFILAFVCASSCCSLRNIKAFWRRICSCSTTTAHSNAANGTNKVEAGEAIPLNTQSHVITPDSSMCTSTPMPQRRHADNATKDNKENERKQLNHDILV